MVPTRDWPALAVGGHRHRYPLHRRDLRRDGAPDAGTVALQLSRVALAKEAWLATIGTGVDRPMRGLPKALHLDNAADFKSRALRMGCGQHGIEPMYRPVRKPHFGGHIERMNRTLMRRLKGRPGATGNSTVGRKAHESADRAALSFQEFERWLTLEVAQRYHHSPHRGLRGARPSSAWATLVQTDPPRLQPPGPDEAMRFLIRLMPSRKDAGYGGVRIGVRATLDGASLALQMDIGFGDAVTPAAQSVTNPTLLTDSPAPTLRAYPKATVVAEKFHAVTVLGITNTRMKDFFDLWVLLHDTTLDDGEL